MKGSLLGGGVKIGDVVDPIAGDKVEKNIGEVTVGVDDSDTSPVSNIGDGHVGDEGGFASSGLTEDVDVTTAVLTIFDTEDGHAVLELGAGEEVSFAFLLVSETFGDREAGGLFPFEGFA